MVGARVAVPATGALGLGEGISCYSGGLRSLMPMVAFRGHATGRSSLYKMPMSALRTASQSLPGTGPGRERGGGGGGQELCIASICVLHCGAQGPGVSAQRRVQWQPVLGHGAAFVSTEPQHLYAPKGRRSHWCPPAPGGGLFRVEFLLRHKFCAKFLCAICSVFCRICTGIR